jgi:hypothetical protein
VATGDADWAAHLKKGETMSDIATVDPAAEAAIDKSFEKNPNDKPSLIDVKASLELIGRVKSISTPEECEQLSTAWRALKDKSAAIVDWFKPRKQKAREALEVWLNDEHAVLDPVDAAIKHAGNVLGAYETERARLARAEATKSAITERAKAQSQILEEATALEEAGSVTSDPSLLFEAHDMVERAVAAPLQVQRPAPVSTPGLKLKPVWIGGFSNKEQLVRSILAKPEHLDLIEIKQSELNKRAEMFKDKLPTVLPGATAEETHKPRKTRD